MISPVTAVLIDGERRDHVVREKEIVKDFAPDILRITPTYIVSVGVNDDIVQPGEGRVRYHGRKVE
jgi:hypothetical protein